MNKIFFRKHLLFYHRICDGVGDERCGVRDVDAERGAGRAYIFVKEHFNYIESINLLVY